MVRPQMKQALRQSAAIVADVSASAFVANASVRTVLAQAGIFLGTLAGSLGIEEIASRKLAIRKIMKAAKRELETPEEELARIIKEDGRQRSLISKKSSDSESFRNAIREREADAESVARHAQTDWLARANIIYYTASCAFACTLFTAIGTIALYGAIVIGNTADFVVAPIMFGLGALAGRSVGWARKKYRAKKTTEQE